MTTTTTKTTTTMMMMRNSSRYVGKNEIMRNRNNRRAVVMRDVVLSRDCSSSSLSSSSSSSSVNEWMMIKINSQRRRIGCGSLASNDGDDDGDSNWEANEFEKFYLRATTVTTDREEEEETPLMMLNESLRKLLVSNTRIDKNVLFLCVYVTRKELSHAELRAITKVSERWNWNVIKKLESACGSLRAKDVEEVVPAKTYGEEIEETIEKLEAVSRAQLYRLCESAEWWGRDSSVVGNSNSTANDEKGSGKSRFDPSTEIACANLRLYFEYLGFRPTGREWGLIQTILSQCLKSEDDREKIKEKISNSNSHGSNIDDTAAHSSDVLSFQDLKQLIDVKTKKPWKDAERANLNARYISARENLIDAKKEWADAEKMYKEARRKVSQARHEVAKNRKHVRIEFR